MKTHYIVKISRARMPSSMKYGADSYRRIAVLEMAEGYPPPPQIRVSRASGVLRVMGVAENVHMGKTEKSQGRKSLAEMEALAEKLNSQGPLVLGYGPPPPFVESTRKPSQSKLERRFREILARHDGNAN